MQFFIIPLYFSEFNQDQKVATSIAEEMSIHFLSKEFGRVKTIHSRVICLPERLRRPPFVDQPLIIHRKEPAASFAYHLDFNRFKIMNQNERKKYLTQEYLYNLEKFSKLKKSTGVNWPTLVNDLSLFFEQTL